MEILIPAPENKTGNDDKFGWEMALTMLLKAEESGKCDGGRNELAPCVPESDVVDWLNSRAACTWVTIHCRDNKQLLRTAMTTY